MASIYKLQKQTQIYIKGRETKANILFTDKFKKEWIRNERAEVIPLGDDSLFTISIVERQKLEYSLNNALLNIRIVTYPEKSNGQLLPERQHGIRQVSESLSPFLRT